MEDSNQVQEYKHSCEDLVMTNDVGGLLNLGPIISIQTLFDWNIWFFVLTSKEERRSFPIYYCPFCGEKLDGFQ